MSSIALDVAHSVAQGASFADSLAAHDGVPHALLPLAETGELHNDIATAMRTGSQVLEGQLMNRSELLEQVLPPVCFILVGGFALTLLLAVFLPLMSLVSNLQ